MRRKLTRNLRSNTPGLRLVGEGESGNAYSPYGPVKAGLTTTQPTSREAQLLELLNSLEKEVENLQSRYYEVLDTWMSASEHLVKLLPTIKDSTTIRE